MPKENPYFPGVEYSRVGGPSSVRNRVVSNHAGTRVDLQDSCALGIT